MQVTSFNWSEWSTFLLLFFFSFSFFHSSSSQWELCVRSHTTRFSIREQWKKYYATRRRLLFSLRQSVRYLPIIFHLRNLFFFKYHVHTHTNTHLREYTLLSWNALGRNNEESRKIVRRDGHAIFRNENCS